MTTAGTELIIGPVQNHRQPSAAPVAKDCDGSQSTFFSSPSFFLPGFRMYRSTAKCTKSKKYEKYISPPATKLSILTWQPGELEYNLQDTSVRTTPTTIWLICKIVTIPAGNHFGRQRAAMRK